MECLNTEFFQQEVKEIGELISKVTVNVKK